MAQGKPPSSSRPPRITNGRGSSARRAPSSSDSFSLTPAQQEQLAALALLVIAVLTALGAFNLSGGNILDGWTRVLSILFGWGRLLTPLFFGGLGAWLLLDSLDRRPDIGWERPLGLIVLFIFFEALFHLPYAGPGAFASAQRGQGGGFVGYAFDEVLVGGLGMPGTVLVLLVLFCIGLVLLFNISLQQILSFLNQGAERLRSFFRRGVHVKLPRRSRNGRTPIEMVTAPSRSANASQAADRAMRDAPTAQTGRALTEGAPGAFAPTVPALGVRIVGDAVAPTRYVHREWQLPRLPDILEEAVEQDISPQEIRTKVRQIEETLAHFGVPAKVVEVNQGPTITQFGVEPGFVEQKAPDGSLRRVKIKVNRISALQHDLELALASAPIRVEAPVPGKSIVGIEVPNTQVSRVSLRGVMESEEFQKLRSKSALALALGQDVSGQPIVADLGKMPHLLVAGATGSGKSVCVNSLISCLLMTNTPDDLKFVMVDPKRVELSIFNGIPHLLTPVVVEMDLAVAALVRSVQEMDERYKKFSQVGARNIENYNALPEERRRGPKLPYLILVVDELADLMMTQPEEVERTITRLAQMARATGIHLVLATQRPSVDVVTGLIKANFPSRISFAVTSQVDSRVVLDTPGAEKLLGRGDMLYMASDSSKLLRLQGCFVSDRELEKLVTHWKSFVEEVPPAASLAAPTTRAPQARVSPSHVLTPGADGWVQGGLWGDLAAAKPNEPAAEDELLAQAIEVVQATDRASISLLQRKLRIGYSRAARLIDLLEQKGMVGPDEGPTKGRQVIKGGIPSASQPSEPLASSPNSSSSTGVRKTSNGAAKLPDKASAPAPPSLSPSAREDRDFQGLSDFDDWSEEDWADLDKD